MKQTVLQESFSAGEISPLSRSRYGSEGYAQGCEILENMYSDPRGPAIGRNGSKFIGRVAGNDARIENVTLSSNEASSIIFTDLKLTIIGLLGTIPNNNYLSDGRFRSGGGAWATVVVDDGTVIFLNDSCVLATSEKAASSAQISQAVAASIGTYSIIVQTDGADEYRVQIGTGVGDGSYYDVITKELEHIAQFTTTAINPTITITSVNIDSAIDIRYVAFTDNTTLLSIVTPWSENEVHDIHIVSLPGGSEMYFLHPKHPPKKLLYDYATNAWTYGSVIFTSPPVEWVANNYPATGAVFQGRLWLGGTPNEPQTFWGSVSGVYVDFTTGALPADALEFTMQKFGQIKWMIGTKNLLVGTANGEHIVTSDGGVITGADIQIEQQSSYGSANVQPRIIGDQVFYISPDRTKVRAMQYEWTSNNWLSRDLTFFSQHITGGKVNGMTWAQHPDNLLFMVMKSGYLGAMNYERGENKWGWHRHITQGDYKSVSSGEVDGASVLTTAIRRTPDFIEIESIVIDGAQDMDSWIEKYSTTAFTIVDGLGHLEGKEVQILADGAVHPDNIVASGQITLDNAANEAVVGLKFTPKLKMLPFEKGVAGSDISVPYEKNFHSIDVHLLDSANPLINGVRVPSRSPATPMGTPEPLTTGKVRMNMCGWNNETDITIEQDLPLPLIVTAVSGEIAQEKL